MNNKLKLHMNEFVIGSHPLQFWEDNTIKRVVLITSFGRMIMYNPSINSYEIYDESLVS